MPTCFWIDVTNQKWTVFLNTKQCKYRSINIKNKLSVLLYLANYCCNKNVCNCLQTDAKCQNARESNAKIVIKMLITCLTRTDFDILFGVKKWQQQVRFFFRAKLLLNNIERTSQNSFLSKCHKKVYCYNKMALSAFHFSGMST